MAGRPRELARADSVYVGSAKISPSTCEVSYNGSIETIEPRVMRVLLALAEAGGRVVGRDELAVACWDVPEVSEDAINRVISRLRRLGEVSGAFRIGTIRKVGYRLTSEDSDTRGGFEAEPLIDDDPSDTIPAVPAQGSAALSLPWRDHGIRWAIIACVLISIAIGAAVLLKPRAASPSSDGKTLVLADFANQTRDPIFDRTLTNLVRADLGQSPFLDVVSEKQAQKTLALILRPTDLPLTPAIAEEICTRNNGDVVLQGEIALVGTRYLLMLTATDCSGVQVLDVEKAEVTSRDMVVPAIDRLIAAVRSKLGESSRSIRAFNVPLLGEPTASLDALKAYSEGKWQFDHGHLADAIALDTHATELDPRFYAAYANLGAIYVALYDEQRAADNFRKAYALRSSANERARLQITSLYAQFVTKDFYATIRNFRLWTAIYPQDAVAWSNLANAEDYLGQHAQAIADGTRALRLKPMLENPYSVVARADLEAGRFAEGCAVGQLAIARGVATDATHRELLRIADARHDYAGIAREEEWAKGAPDALRTEEVEAEMALSRGQVGAAASLFDAISTTIRERGTYDYMPPVRARLLSELGLTGEARDLLSPATEEMKTDPDYLFTLARVGNADRADRLLGEWLRQSPADTLLNQVFASEVRAALALRRGNPTAAIAALRPALPFAPRSLDIPYLAGTAWLAAGAGQKAASAFQTVLTHPGWSPESPLYPLSDLGLARALRLKHDEAGSEHAYRSFLARWKDADPRVPVLAAARSEYAQLVTSRH